MNFLKDKLVTLLIILFVILFFVMISPVLLVVLTFQLIKLLHTLFWRLIRRDSFVRIEKTVWQSKEDRPPISDYSDNIKNYAKFVSERVDGSILRINEVDEKKQGQEEPVHKVKAEVRVKNQKFPQLELKFAAYNEDDCEIYGDPEDMDTKKFDDWHFYGKLYNSPGEKFLLELEHTGKSLWVAISFLRGDAKIVQGKQLWCYLKEYDVWLVKYALNGSASFGLRKKFTGKVARKYWFDA